MPLPIHSLEVTREYAIHVVVVDVVLVVETAAAVASTQQQLSSSSAVSKGTFYLSECMILKSSCKT